jgi:CheY-like chemotaxis protein
MGGTHQDGAKAVTDLDTILLVEDTPDDLELLKYAFGKAGITNPLMSVRDGDEAISFIGGNGAYTNRAQYPLPSLVLLDLKLPKRSGFEVLRFIRAQDETKHIPVVVLTSSNQREDVGRSYELGANSYLVKPVRRDGLLEMVKAIDVYWIKLNRVPGL